MAHRCRRRTDDPNYDGPERRTGDGGGEDAYLITTKRETWAAAATLLLSVATAITTAVAARKPDVPASTTAQPGPDVVALSRWARAHEDAARPLIEEFTTKTLPRVAALTVAVDGIQGEVRQSRTETVAALSEVRKSVDDLRAVVWQLAQQRASNLGGGAK